MSRSKDPQDKRGPVCFSLSPREVELLDQLAEAKRVSRSVMIRKLIKGRARKAGLLED